MTDGPTGFQVAPITEDEMTQVRNILQRAADAIVGMSQLHADVDMLRQTVGALQADTDRLRQTNANLDEALAYTRKERDEARTELMQVKGQVIEITNDRDEQLRLANAYCTQLDGTMTELAYTKTERDDHGFRVMELEESLKSAEAKLAKIAEAHVTVFGQVIAAPSATMQEPHPIQAVSEPVPEPSTDPKPWEPAATPIDYTNRYLSDGFTPNPNYIPF